jgi:hypothetical protein
MNYGLTMALVTLSVTLLGTLIVSTWRFSSLATKLLAAVQRLEEKEKEQDTKLSLLNDIPVMKSEMDHMMKNHSLIPHLMGEVRVLQEKAQFSKEMRHIRLGSRPDDGGSDSEE